MNMQDLQRRLSQVNLSRFAEQSGIPRKTLQRQKAGELGTLSNYLRTLEALDRLHPETREAEAA